MYSARTFFLAAALALLSSSAFAATANVRQQTTFPGPGAGAPLQYPQESSMPSETARPQGLPSGQGTFIPPAPPEPPMPGYPGQGPVMSYAPVPQGYSVRPQPLYMQGAPRSTVRSFIGVPAWMQVNIPGSASVYPPFGANLFQGNFSGTYYEGLNDNYIIMPGDRILINIWGAYAYSDTLMVDQQGNIFLPEAGPLQVAGLRHGMLQSAVKAHLASSFRSNIDVYANLLTAQPVAVYVTGFVQRPGRYAGGMSDSVLYYLDKAGGILPDRGSYRDIAIRRNNRAVAAIDLYNFILDGHVNTAPLRDGDVIIVGKKGDCVLASGLIPQLASFESKNKIYKGSELINYASPLPATSHVSVSGTRNAVPFNVYLRLSEFADFTLSANDKVEFLADKPGDSIMVSISGSMLGPTHYPVKRNTGLRSLLAHIPVDPELSNLSGIYIKRKSVVEQQRRAIHDALRRLESSVLTAPAATGEIAAIRTQEAALVRDFVLRASTVEPDGVVVVTRSGVTADILLEDGDEVVIPQNSDVVHISGEVMIPKAVVHMQGQKLARYLAEAGGLSARGDSGNILVVHPNGEIAQARDTSILPGDMILVMPEYDSKSFSIFKDIMQVLYQIAISTKIVLS